MQKCLSAGALVVSVQRPVSDPLLRRLQRERLGTRVGFLVFVRKSIELHSCSARANEASVELVKSSEFKIPSLCCDSSPAAQKHHQQGNTKGEFVPTVKETNSIWPTPNPHINFSWSLEQGDFVSRLIFESCWREITLQPAWSGRTSTVTKNCFGVRTDVIKVLRWTNVRLKQAAVAKKTPNLMSTDLRTAFKISLYVLTINIYWEKCPVSNLHLNLTWTFFFKVGCCFPVIR